jgi:hypothetical protein
MRKTILAVFFMLIISKVAFAEEYIIAHGENPKGKSYFAYTGMVAKKDSGWKNNGIKNGIFEVVLNNNKLDIRYVDAAKRIVSSASDGGQVTLLNKGKNEISILVNYPKNGIEVYSFYVDKDGKNKFILTQSRGGENVPIAQSSIFEGSCDFIYFNKFPE